ncbi:hypothetical protein FRB09_05700 [Haemophilus influenzae]|uniref:Uncharacterized protein n=1 Tax=Haemophilus influenzae TaxID=727 RepID=A0A346JXI6_HAEIF|nr:hypothetical protein CH628_10275 [Haemophilus influenzae]AXP46698.1 hypothetical protein CH639_09190 [Haemophilus influenzae]AXP60339.1 hypothetical protein CH597_09050 [Haemophilus influenzae]AXP63835.1 hypothetical protein CH578_09130 [Haemophilus influenzae]AXP65545.1 hypothetical protein CH635_09185 [Haemophilus influenzae]
MINNQHTHFFLPCKKPQEPDRTFAISISKILNLNEKNKGLIIDDKPLVLINFFYSQLFWHFKEHIFF